MATGDLTSKDQAELVLYRAIVALLPTGIALIRASDGTIVWANDRLATILGSPRDALTGRPASVIGDVGPRETFEHPEYGSVWLAISTTAEAGRPAGATPAPVRTGASLPGRGSSQDDLRREIARAKRTGTELSVAMLALDGELDIADPATIERLSAATEAWRGALRDSDTIAYYEYGKLAYIALLPDCPQEVALMVTERARTATSEQTCSAGYACWNLVEGGFQLAARAHRALLAARRAGGDRSMLAPTG
jgi:GGDEF domain-containing protein